MNIFLIKIAMVTFVVTFILSLLIRLAVIFFRTSKGSNSKKEFLREYTDILNNPKYKVKKFA